jgi:hypothetical protein
LTIYTLFMKKISFAAILLLSMILSDLHAQTWVSITPPRGNFSFSLPAFTAPLDTLSLLSYNYVLPTDSTISFQVHYMDGVPVAGNTDLQTYLGGAGSADTITQVLDVYGSLFQQFTSGTIEGFVDTTYQSRIRGETLTVLHPGLNGDSATQYFAFTRYYYYNSKFVAFTLMGPQSEVAVLNGYKNQLFSSIALFW